jgi:methionyl-tRNA synthetase
MKNKDSIKKIFIGVAWPYVNGDIHIGHLAGYLIPCDIFARYSRLKGNDVLMVSGTDCHGTPITVAADKKGVTPQEIVNEYDPKVRDLIKLYDTSYDLFTRTTTENHKSTTQRVFLNLLVSGYIIKQTSKQYYSEQEKKFLPDRYVEGECPYCHAKDQRADQCENCGRTLGLGELISPKSKLTGSEVILKDTEHYFIDFPKLQDEIKNHVSKYEGEWRPWVWKETMGWLNEGLEPRAITRDLDWGVEIPDGQIPEKLRIENSEHKRFYVWFDAVIGYLSAAIEWASSNGRDWKEFWINPECKHYYFMGKDNLAFHTIFWPGQLIGQEENFGGKLNLIDVPVINQFLNLEGQKFSKSRGIYLDAYKIGDYFGVDTIRFYLASILPENSDANWQWTDFQNTINNELVGNFGNFVHRTLTFYQNKLNTDIRISNSVLEDDVEKFCNETFAEVNENMEKCNIVSALNSIMRFSKFGNQYFDRQKPWVSIKESRDQSERSIYNCLQIVYSLKTLLTPFLPGSMEKLNKILGISELTPTIGVDKYKFDILNMASLYLAPDFSPLFQKLETEKLDHYKDS